MPSEPDRANRRVPAAATTAVCCIVLFALMVTSQQRKSPVMDELVGPAVGLAEMKTGDRGFVDVHPPLARTLQALPLMSTDLRPAFGSRDCPRGMPLRRCMNEMAIRTFYSERVADPDRLLDRSRRVNQLFAAACAAIACAVAFSVGGWSACAVTGVLFATSPMWIAHGRIATNDMPYTAIAFFAAAALWQYRKNGKRLWLAATGLLLGLSLSAKFAAIPLAAGAFAVLFFDRLGSENDRATASRRCTGVLAAFAVVLFTGFIALAAVAAVYRGHMGGLARDLFLLIARMGQGHAAYFLGETSKTGWAAYFPVAFLLKTPVGTLGLLLLSIVAGARSAIQGGGKALWWSWVPPFLLPAILFAGLSLTSKVNIGLRYWLPLYPALFLAIGIAASTAARKRWAAVVVALALTANAAGAVAAYPHYLSSFNVLAGGPKNGAKYLSDSNIDWGQDMAELGRVLQSEGIDRVALAYFSPTPPSAAGIRYQYVYSLFNQENPDAAPDQPAPDYLAASVTLQTGQYLHGLEWLREEEPVARAGWSIEVFDISEDAGAHLRLAALYRSLGMDRTARRHAAKADAIGGSHR